MTTKRLSIQDLARIREKTRSMTVVREGAGRAKITVHMGTCGIVAGAREVMEALLDAVAAGGFADVLVTTSGCAGFCNREPMATVEIADRPPVKYAQLTPDKIRKILAEHVAGGQIVTEYALAVGSETEY